MEIKVEAGTAVCDICFSVGRKVNYLGRYSDIFAGILTDYNLKWEPQYIANIVVCWECEALLRRIVEFRKKVLYSFECAQSYYNEKRLDSLSTLQSSTPTDDSNTYNFKHLEEVEIEIKPKEEKIEANTENLEDDDNTDYALDNTEIDNLTDNPEPEVKVEVQKKIKRSKITKKKKSVKKTTSIQNQKYTVLNLKEDVQGGFRKIPINETEVWECMRLERDSKFFKEKPYKCNKCVLVLRNEGLLQRHNEDLHELTHPNKCLMCECTFENTDLLHAHTKTHYYKHVCLSCNTSSYSQQFIRRHVIEKHQRTLICKECGLRYDSRKEIVAHHKNMHQTFVCDHCGVTKKSAKSIEKHLKMSHSEYECKICNKTFARKKYFQYHNKYKHGEQGTENAYCVECNKHFINIYAYKSHINETVLHRPQKKVRIPCPECDKVFSKRTYMTDHYNLVHLKISKHRCPHCDKSFLRNDHLIRHVRIVHEGVPKPKNKMCYVCGRGFSSNNILANHMRTHTGERPFACPRCPARFAQSSALVSHARSVHKERMKHSTDIGLYPAMNDRQY